MAKRRHVKNPGVPGTAGGGGAGPTGGGYSTRDLVYVFDARANVLDGVGNPVTAGNPVTTWEPVYGSEALTQAAAPNQPTLSTNPINGLAAIDFGGSHAISAATTKLGGATSWTQTCIVVWSSAATPTPAGTYRGLFGWANNVNGTYYNWGAGLMQGLQTLPLPVGDVENVYGIVGDGTGTFNFDTGTDPTQTATNVHIIAAAYTSTAGGGAGGPALVEDYTGAAQPVGIVTSVGGAVVGNRTSQAMSAGSYANLASTDRCLDGQIQAIYVWNRAMELAEMFRTVKIISGRWRG